MAAKIEPLIAMDRQPHYPHLAERFTAAPASSAGTPVEATAYRQKTPDGKKLSALRKQMPEPTFGIIKSVLGFRQFLPRGLERVHTELSLVTMAWNIKRMFALRPARYGGAGESLLPANHRVDRQAGPSRRHLRCARTPTFCPSGMVAVPKFSQQTSVRLLMPRAGHSTPICVHAASGLSVLVHLNGFSSVRLKQAMKCSIRCLRSCCEVKLPRHIRLRAKIENQIRFGSTTTRTWG